MQKYDQFLLELSRTLILNATCELPEIIDKFTQKVCDFLDCDRASIWLYNSDKNAIQCATLYLKDQATHQSGQILSKNDYTQYFLALETERIIEASDALEHHATACFRDAYLTPLHIKSLYDTPIWKVNDVIGVLCLEYTKEKKVWDIKEKSFFTSLADFLAKTYEKLSVLELVESLDQKVKERTQQLNQALEDIKVTQKNLMEQERLASLGTVIAGISHEIRNPLNIIHSASLAISQILESDTNYPKDIERFAQMIHSASTRTNTIIQDMLDISSDRKKYIPTDLNELIKYSLKLVNHGLAQYHDFNPEIKLQLADLPAKILLPKQEIQRVFVNLFENAMQSMIQKSQSLPDYISRLEVKTNTNSQNLVIEIKDNGLGIKHEIVKKIFDPFFSTKAPGKGTGLGLSIVHDIITRNEGKISCQSIENESATFSITLPLQLAS